MPNFFPQPKQVCIHGRSRRFDPEAGVRIVADGKGDFARAREVIADEIAKAFPNAVLSPAAGKAKWELRLALGLPRPEPEAYRLTVSGTRIAVTGSTWRGLLCGWATLRQLLDPESGEVPALRDAEIAPESVRSSSYIVIYPTRKDNDIRGGLRLGTPRANREKDP